MKLYERQFIKICLVTYSYLMRNTLPSKPNIGNIVPVLSTLPLSSCREEASGAMADGKERRMAAGREKRCPSSVGTVRKIETVK